MRQVDATRIVIEAAEEWLDFMCDYPKDYPAEAVNRLRDAIESERDLLDIAEGNQ